MQITDEAFAAAKARGAKASEPHAVAARFLKSLRMVEIQLSTSAILRFPVSLSAQLRNAKAPDLEVIEITPTGLGLHWPRLDADLYVPGALAGHFGPRKTTSAQILGRAGGKATASLKANAARANGALGGRPKKQTATG